MLSRSNRPSSQVYTSDHSLDVHPAARDDLQLSFDATFCLSFPAWPVTNTTDERKLRNCVNDDSDVSQFPIDKERSERLGVSSRIVGVHIFLLLILRQKDSSQCFVTFSATTLPSWQRSWPMTHRARQRPVWTWVAEAVAG
jgi:hypothetical protein